MALLTAPTHPPTPDAPALTLARAVTVDGETVGILTEAGLRATATRAASCLLHAAPGDRVLVTDPGDGAWRILAVLDRAAVAATLSVRDAPETRLDARRLHLAGDESVAVTTPDLAVDAGRATLRAHAAHFVGDLLAAAAGTLEVAAERLRSVADTILVRAGSHTRSTERVDTVVAGHLLRRAEGAATLTAEHAVVTARGDVRIDGERVNLG